MQHEAKQKLNELLAATRHVLNADDIDDILELDRLAEQVESALAEERAELPVADLGALSPAPRGDDNPAG